MSRIAKLNLRFLTGGNLTFAEFRLLLEAYGWTLDRVGGSHHVYRHPLTARPFPVTPDGKDARRYQLKQARDMIELFGLRMDDA